MTNLQVVGTPDNLTYRGPGYASVDSDVFNICGRIREISPSLRVVLREGAEKPWTVVEMCSDGVERFVASYEALDQRILEDLRYMLAVPFEKRFEASAREVDRHNDALGDMPEEKMERFAWDMQRALVESNIVNPKWSKSTPLVKRG